MKKEWKYKEIDKNIVQSIAEENNLNETLAILLQTRNLTTKDEIDLYLNPKRSDFHDPFLINDMKKAVSRIIEAINKNEIITIYGDYDVDGVTSSTVLVNFLREINANINTYIPNRHTEGYGMNNAAIDLIATKNTSLIITVDCGITAVKEVEYAKIKNIDVIITDHHEPKDILPDAYVVIDNKIKSSKYPFSELAGVGVAYKLIQALSMELGLKEEVHLKYLDIVCTGTIADMVPLVNENRVITNLGLKLLKQTRNQGLREILISSNTKEIDSNTVPFKIAPKINACGRMSDASLALSLFTSNNPQEVKEIVEKINSYNELRREIEKEITLLVIKNIEDNNLDENNIIVVCGNNWHHGVIGIVASKITNIYNKPCILLTTDDLLPNMLKGSGRSIEGFNLHKALKEVEPLLENFGGHSAAVGLQVNANNINPLREKLNFIGAREKISDIVPVIKIDCNLYLNSLSIDLVKSLKVLEPYGEANERPVFCFEKVTIKTLRTLTENKHLKLTVSSNNLSFDAIGFSLGHLEKDLNVNDVINIVGTLEINSFNNKESVQIGIIDIKVV